LTNSRTQRADPFEFRRALLATIRDTNACWNLSPKKPGGGTLAAGRGRGIAMHESFELFAHVIEASVSKEGKVRVHRIIGAVDCGPVVNPTRSGAD